MRVAITGGSGAIGTYVCDEFIRAGHEVVSVDMRPPKIDVPFVEVDLCDFQATCETLQGFDRVVHLAAIPDPFSDPPEKLIPSPRCSTSARHSGCWDGSLNMIGGASRNGSYDDHLTAFFNSSFASASDGAQVDISTPSGFSSDSSFSILSGLTPFKTRFLPAACILL